MLPGFRDPVYDLDELITAHVLIDLHLDQFPAQETAQKAPHRLRVIRTQHPPAQSTHKHTRLRNLYIYWHFR